MTSLAQVLSFSLILLIVLFQNRFQFTDGCKIRESSILFNFQKGDNIITKLFNKLGARKCDDTPSSSTVDGKFAYSAPPISSYSFPAHEDLQSLYQYYYVPYSPTQFYPPQYTSPIPPTHLTSYTNSQLEQTGHSDHELPRPNAKKDSPPQTPTTSDVSQHGPTYTTSIIINNEPRQIIPSQPPAPQPVDTTRAGCSGHCQQHPQSYIHQSTPVHIINQDDRLSNRPQTAPAYSAPILPVNSPTMIHYDTPRSDSNISLPPANNEYRMQPLPSDRHYSQPYPVLIRENTRSRYQNTNPHNQPFPHYNPPAHVYQDRSSSSSYNSHHDRHPASSPNFFPAERYEISRDNSREVVLPYGRPQPEYTVNRESSFGETSAQNCQYLPKVIESSKPTSVVAVESKPSAMRSDLPDTTYQFQPQELLHKVETGYRMIPVRSRPEEQSQFYLDDCQPRVNGQLAHRSHAFNVNRQELSSESKISYDASALTHAGLFKDTQARSLNKSTNRFS